MPREQIRKRGKRKPKTEESGAAPPKTEVEPVQSTSTLAEAGPSTSHNAGAGAGGAGGIHPSRLALLKGGPRPASPPAQVRPSAEGAGGSDFIPFNSDGAAGQPSGVGAAEDSEEGAAQWIRGPRTDSEFPFGVLDPDLKGYFKTVEEQIKDWEGSGWIGEEREDRQNFLTSVLGELRSHELTVATDPECSVVLERLLPSMGDWGRRVLGDTFSGSWETLMRHRFGSHVVQSWIRLAADTIEREARGEYPPQQLLADGSLRSASTLVVDLIDSLTPTLPTLLTHQYASPPIRLLLLVLSPNKELPDLSGEGGDGGVRSKRSGKFRKGQAVKGTSIVEEQNKDKGKGKGKQVQERLLTDELKGKRTEVREGLMAVVGENEWRIMGVDVVGSVAVQLLLECEVEDQSSLHPSSLLDHLTEGLITSLSSDDKPLAKQYIPSLLVSQAGTHMLESILTSSPQNVFDAIWELYFAGKLGRLAGHPMGNYVVARGVGRLDVGGLVGAVGEVQGNAGGRGLIKSGRTSVLLAMIERATALKDGYEAITNILYTSLQITASESSFLVPCLMSLKTYPIYQALLAGEDVKDEEGPAPETIDQAAEDQAAAAAKYAAWQNRRTPKAPTTGLEPQLQGSLMLQALVRMGREEVFESLFAQTQETLLTYATNPIASRFLDAVLTAPSDIVAPKWRKKLMMAFMGKYKDLVQDRIGSRVGDTVWDVADGFMKEKIARSLAPHATALSNSPFGRFYATKLKLHLLQRRPDEWKQEVIGVRHYFAHQKDAVPASTAPAQVEAKEAGFDSSEPVQKEKRKKREKDEIDSLFAGAVKKSKKQKA